MPNARVVSASTRNRRSRANLKPSAGGATTVSRQSLTDPSTCTQAVIPGASIYIPLGSSQIRVLQLQPARTLTAPLIGAFDLIELGEAQYEALSYTWGRTFEEATHWNTMRCPPRGLKNNVWERTFSSQPSEPGELWLDGYPIPTAANLHTALRRLRYLGKPRAVWIDAICINQHDLLERSSQVAQMGQIFRHAWRVVIWAGEDSINHDAQCVFDYCRKYENIKQSWFSTTWRAFVVKVLEKIKYSNSNPKRAISRILQWTGGFTYIELQFSTKPLVQWRPTKQYNMLRIFASRSYFRRRWCVQEVDVAKNAILQCGTLELPWSTFVTVLQGVSALDEIRSLVRIKQVKYTVLQLAELGRHMCLDRRDCIYAIASLLTRCEDCPRLEIDYTLDWATVYTRFARDYIKLNGPHAAWVVLVYASFRHSHPQRDCDSPDRMPSWVPDWSNPSIHAAFLDTLMIFTLVRQRYYQSDGNATFRCDDHSIIMDMWYLGQVGPSLAAQFTLRSEDCVYRLPSEFEDDRDFAPKVVLRQCGAQETTFQVTGIICKVDIEEELNGVQRETHRVTII